MDFDTKLSNVSFGGNWSEELKTLNQLKTILADLEWAVENCTEFDIRTEGVLAALAFVRDKIEKGAMHEAAFLKAAAIGDQHIRQRELGRVFDRIKLWAGL